MKNKFCLFMLSVCSIQMVSAMDDGNAIVAVEVGKTRYMLLKRHIDQSAVLRDGLQSKENGEFSSTTNIPYEKFKSMVPYLKLGCDHANLDACLSAYSKKKLDECVSAAACLGIGTVLNKAEEIRKEKGWLIKQQFSSKKKDR